MPVPPLEIPTLPVRPTVSVSVEEIVIFLPVTSLEMETLEPAVMVKVSSGTVAEMSVVPILNVLKNSASERGSMTEIMGLCGSPVMSIPAPSDNPYTILGAVKFPETVAVEAKKAGTLTRNMG